MGTNGGGLLVLYSTKHVNRNTASMETAGPSIND